jgi:hypothetical protein
MSSVTSQMAQVGRKINYFRALDTVSGYLLSGVTFDAKGISAVPSLTTVTTSGNILQDMGAMYQYNGQIFRQVRVVSQNPAGGDAAPYLICMPGGEYPVHGRSAAGPIATPAAVVRLG